MALHWYWLMRVYSMSMLHVYPRETLDLSDKAIAQQIFPVVHSKNNGLLRFQNLLAWAEGRARLSQRPT